MRLFVLVPAILAVGCGSHDDTSASNRYQFVESPEDRPALIFDRQTGCLAEATGFGWTIVGDEEKGTQDEPGTSIDDWVCPQTPQTKVAERTQ